MSTATTLAAYSAALVVVFGAAVAVGPIGAAAEPAHSTGAPHGATTPSGPHGDSGHVDSGHADSGHEQ